MVPGIQIKKIPQSYTLSIIAKTPTMEKRTLQVQDVLDILMSGAQVQNTILIHSTPKKCVASVEEATIMTKQVVMKTRLVNVLTQTMELQTHMETIVTTTLQILPGVACMIQTHSFLVTCAVVVEEVLIVKTLQMMIHLLMGHMALCMTKKAHG